MHVFEVNLFEIGVSDLGSVQNRSQLSVPHDPHACSGFFRAEEIVGSHQNRYSRGAQSEQ